ncbi:response regulator transcription factor [Streptosporangium sp. NBC_01639]|uniref:response regulator transcription factor n=1 Tax=unclassified Streptosporangium TaxID=2632669 RepID=UPI002DD9485C|nr:response regulator transcription factor [Streptosporangium sp. NBC_01756]WSC89613.1 response regulator transcription factor [Streptosporangium sp. NBC_01756]WTD51744.1 response regulator transcription factor [Streptosporangium sp. NBC_01639]
MIRVLIAEDVRILREALVALLGYEEDIDVVAALETGDAIVPAALAHRPDVAVLDIDLPGLDGLAAAAELYERLPVCRVLILTALGRPGNLRRGVAARVSGFMLKDSRPEDLVNAIRDVAAGRRVIDQQLAYATLDVPASPLTEREADVLRLTGAGAAPRGIARDLNLSYGTVRNYLASAVTKLNARTRSDAVRIATEAGWL